MKTKTIKKIITKKMEAWLKTIDDKQLASDVKDNLLVSGGSIASMLLKIDVNDYDVYIQDKEVLLRLAAYYCEHRVFDGRRRDEYLKECNPDVFDNGGLSEGGSKFTSEQWVRLANLKEDQVKLDLGGAGHHYKHKEVKPGEYKVAFLSQNAISLTNDVQIVLRFSGTVEQIHKTFDFIHATNYFTFKDGLVLNPMALESLLTKNLMYQGSLYPLTSIIRMKKFILRHWSIGAGEILKIMFQISQLDLTDIEVLEEQLIGVDVAYFSALIDALRGVSQESITVQVINDLIDKVFNECLDDNQYD